MKVMGLSIYLCVWKYSKESKNYVISGIWLNPVTYQKKKKN